MRRFLLSFAFLASLVIFAAPEPAEAASFDCSTASTPFEKAICGNAELSHLDAVLDVAYRTALGGLSETARARMVADQRRWLDYAQRVCTADANVQLRGAYPEHEIYCLQNVFGSRIEVLESSRMVEKLRFYPASNYAALRDPEAPADSGWSVARKEIGSIRIDGTSEVASRFNAFMDAEAVANPVEETLAASGEDNVQSDGVSSVSDARISLERLYWFYPHGAAHGQGYISFLHFLIAEQRPLRASDIFAGKGWERALRNLVLAELREQLGSDLMLDDASLLDQIVTDPQRWNFEADRLEIQFGPYEVAAYAYGLPSVGIDWQDLAPLLSEDAAGITGGRWRPTD